MAGILDPKTRVLDFILTAQGRRTLAQKGMFTPTFVSFADDKVYYEKMSKTGSVAEDPSSRLYVEANTFDKDSLFSVSGSLLAEEKMSRSAHERSSILLSNLKNLRILQSVPSYLEDEIKFRLSKTSIEFTPNGNDVDIAQTEDIDNLSAIFQDKHFQHIKNYKYLPPINSHSKNLLGDYPKLNTDEILTDADLAQMLEFKQVETIEVAGGLTPRNLMFRIFEEDEGTKKSSVLEMVDYGSYTDENKEQKRIFFVGKTFDDQHGVPVFVNLFTLVFS
tara:strand:+ start:493 stop:1323 length:831 start_codon:yes stop_codon:yes gene_type:complete